MRIGIDARYLSHGLMGGVHTYIAQFIPELVRQAQRHEVILYADTKSEFELKNLPDNVTVRFLPWSRQLSYITNDYRALPRLMASDHLDVAHYPANYGFGPKSARTVVTLHDSLTLQPVMRSVRGLALSNSQNPREIAMAFYLHYGSRRALRKAALVLTVSEYARRDIMDYTKFDPSRIVAIPHGLTDDVQRVTAPEVLQAVRERYNLTRPYILADALKNPEVLLRAWPLLPETIRASHQLVFFCRRPDPLPAIHAAEAAGYARLFVRPPRADLIALYSMADAFVFPSWIEGFGIPILEAMRCGAPVIASATTAIPEVVGDAGLLVDPEDEATLAQHLVRVLAEPGFAADLRQRGLARAARYTWRQTASMILDCHEQIFANPTGAVAPRAAAAIGAGTGQSARITQA